MRKRSAFSLWKQQAGVIIGYHPDQEIEDSTHEEDRDDQHQKEDNRQSIGEFIVSTILWMMLAMYWYRIILFRLLDYQTLSTSKLVLWGLVLASTFLGTILTIKYQRKSSNIFFSLVMGYGIYTFIAYIHIRPALTKGLLWSAIAVSGLYIVMQIVGRYIGKTHRLPVRLVFQSMLLAVHKVFGVAFAIIIAVTWTARISDSSYLRATVTPTNVQNNEKQTIQENMETLVVLHDEARWAALTVQEKLDVLQTIANIEQRYLGLPHELNVGIEDTEGENGNYDDLTHEIMISTRCLLDDSSWKLVKIVCHEAYHAYQHRLIDLWDHADQESKGLIIFQRIRSYAEEFQNYISGKENFKEYYIQQCERDARDYSEDAQSDYYIKIRDYLYPENGQGNPVSVPLVDDSVI